MDAATEARIVERLDRMQSAIAELLDRVRAGGPRAAPRKAPAAKARRVTVREFCERQQISPREFGRNYARLFTDTRAPDKRGVGRHRKLMADEVELFFSDGVEAVANFRRRAGRD